MKKKNIASIAVLSIITDSIAAAAFGVQKTINVTEGVSVFMNGKELEMKDVNGNDVDAFVYDGTTYLPARAISEANGNSVAWDGGVKEQGPGVYANELAKRGFALSDAAMDTRIKAVVTSSMYDISAMGNNMSSDERNSMITGLSEQRWTDFENGMPAYARTYPADAPLTEFPADLTGTNIEWWTFYAMKRGWHPNSGGAFTNTSSLSFANYSLLNHIDDISPRPIMFITGDIAHSRSMSEEFYEMAEEPKELVVIPGAMHIDLYDRVDLIPFDDIESFFNEAF